MPSSITLTPGAYTREFDLSLRPQTIAQINKYALVGFTQKGPAFIPTEVQNYGNEFYQTFGGLDPDYTLPYAAKPILQNGTRTLVTRVLGTDSTLALNSYVPLVFALTSTTASSIASISGKAVAILRLREDVAGTMSVGYTGSATSFSLSITGVTLTGSSSAYTSSATGTVTGLSIDPTSVNYIEKKLGTNPINAVAGDLLTSVYVEHTYSYYADSTTADVTTYGQANYNSALTATTSALPSSANVISTSNQITFGSFTNASTPWVVSQNHNGVVYNLFRFHTISDGNYSNKEIKVNISAIVPATDELMSKFTVTVRTFDDTDRGQVILEQFRNVTLNSTDKNYIGRVIGDMYQTFNPSTGEITPLGTYQNKSKYVYVEVNADNIPFDAEPSGFSSIEYLTVSTTIDIPQTPFKLNQLYQSDYSSQVSMGPDYDTYGKELYSIFTALPSNSAGVTTQKGLLLLGVSETSASSSLSSSYVMSQLSTTGNQRLKQFNVPFFGGWDGIEPTIAVSAQQTSLSSSIVSAINILSDTEQFDFDIFAMPGITLHALNTKAVTMLEERADAYGIIDDGDKDVAKSSITGSGYYGDFDTSYACGNWPWITIYDAENDLSVTVPPCIGVLEAMAYNDKVKFEWWAAAGLNRGIISATDVYTRLKEEDLLSLVSAKVNPIRKYRGNVVRWGQKTFQRKDSDLNNETVRRLLIKSRKLIAAIAQKYIFEPNIPATWQRFTGEVNPILEDIQKKQGLVTFQVVMDETTNTADQISRNEMNAKIALQPTIPGEVFLIDFYITKVGVTFANL